MIWTSASSHYTCVHILVNSSLHPAFSKKMCYLPSILVCFWLQARDQVNHSWPKLSNTNAPFGTRSFLRVSPPAALASLLVHPLEPQNTGKTHSDQRPFYPFEHLHLLSSYFFSSLIFFLLLFSSLSSHPCFSTLLFQLSIASEVWLLKFLQLIHSTLHGHTDNSNHFFYWTHSHCITETRMPLNEKTWLCKIFRLHMHWFFCVLDLLHTVVKNSAYLALRKKTKRPIPLA